MGLQTCMSLCVRTCVRAYVRVCLCSCVCVPACMCLCMVIAALAAHSGKVMILGRDHSYRRNKTEETFVQKTKHL